MHVCTALQYVSLPLLNLPVVIAQAAQRDFFLKILEKSGLRRTQQGAAILLTGRDVEEEVLVTDLAVIRKEELLNLKKVPHCICALQHSLCAALSFAEHVILYHCQACYIDRLSTVLRADHSEQGNIVLYDLAHQELHEGRSTVSSRC